MTDPLHTILVERLGCSVPIVQTAMGWIATPGLVIASSQAGAFGFLAAAVMTPGEVRAAIEEVKRGTRKPFGVNFHSFQHGADEIVDITIEHNDQIRAVSFGRGPDTRMIGRFKDAGILCVPTVGAVKHARKMVRLGVDMVTVQGGEGGGHTGSVPSMILLPQILDSVNVPVIAAGGFGDGRGLAAALAFGAAGIAMGTRFLMTRESPVPDNVKARYLKADTDDIVVSTKVDGLPQRMIRNEMLERIEKDRPLGKWLRGLESGIAMKRQTSASLRSLLEAARQMRSHTGLTLAQALTAAAAPMMIQKAVVGGDADGGLMATGMVAGRLDDLPTCEELIFDIVSQARSRIAALGNFPSFSAAV